jgi:SET domain-containing protein
MKWIIAKSPIEGVGVYMTQNIDVNQYIDTAIQSDNTITFFGSKINHSWTPNTKLIYDSINRTYDVYSNKPIKNGTELTIDYTFTPSFIKKPLKHWK